MSRTNPRLVVPANEGTFGDDVESRTKRLRLMAKLLDSAIPIPGTSWKIGFDPIVGLIPGIGDLIGAVLSGYIILEAARSEIPPLTLARMLVNVGIDTLLGAVPAVGDLFDAAWKSNTKNVALLEHHLAVQRAVVHEKRNAVGLIVLALVVLVLIVGAGLALGILASRLLWGLKTG